MTQLDRLLGLLRGPEEPEEKTKPPGLRILAASKLLGSSGVGRVAFLHKGNNPSRLFTNSKAFHRKGAAEGSENSGVRAGGVLKYSQAWQGQAGPGEARRDRATQDKVLTTIKANRLGGGFVWLGMATSVPARLGSAWLVKTRQDKTRILPEPTPG